MAKQQIGLTPKQADALKQRLRRQMGVIEDAAYSFGAIVTDSNPETEPLVEGFREVASELEAVIDRRTAKGALPTPAEVLSMNRGQLTAVAKQLGIKSPQRFLVPELREYVASAVRSPGTTRF